MHSKKVPSPDFFSREQNLGEFAFPPPSLCCEDPKDTVKDPSLCTKMIHLLKEYFFNTKESSVHRM